MKQQNNNHNHVNAIANGAVVSARIVTAAAALLTGAAFIGFAAATAFSYAPGLGFIGRTLVQIVTTVSGAAVVGGVAAAGAALTVGSVGVITAAVTLSDKPAKANRLARTFGAALPLAAALTAGPWFAGESFEEMTASLTASTCVASNAPRSAEKTKTSDVIACARPAPKRMASATSPNPN